MYRQLRIYNRPQKNTLYTQDSRENVNWFKSWEQKSREILKITIVVVKKNVPIKVIMISNRIEWQKKIHATDLV